MKLWNVKFKLYPPSKNVREEKIEAENPVQAANKIIDKYTKHPVKIITVLPVVGGADDAK